VAEPWWSSWVGPVVPYAVLLRLFSDGGMTADEFEVVFLRLYKLDPTQWPANLFAVLDSFFADVDAYCPDDALRKEVGGLDADELRQRASQTLSRLKELAG
jgi:Bacterial self-protective colicin-like immunity